jgi:hypothetical protein
MRVSSSRLSVDEDLSRSLVDSVLAATGRGEQRSRLLPARLLVYFVAGEGRLDLHATYEDIRSYGDVSQVYEGFYVTTRYAILDELLRDPRTHVGDRGHLRQ